MRFQIVLDRASNGTDLVDSEVMISGAQFGLRDPSYRRRYKVLRDIYVDFNPTTASTMVSKINIFLPFEYVVQYSDAATGTYLDIESGALYLVCPAIADATVTFVGNARVRFTDH